LLQIKKFVPLQRNSAFQSRVFTEPRRMETQTPVLDPLWMNCLSLFRNNLPEQQFNTWFAPILSAQFDAERRELTLCVPSPFIYEYIEAHYVKLLRAVLTRVYGTGVRLIYKVTTDATNNISMQIPTTTHVPEMHVHNAAPVNQAPQMLQQFDSQLNPAYTFDNFVEGAANKLPLTVGRAIAQTPRQTTFNPLFIYGGSGTGKTHLVNAIGNRLKELHPELRVLYISAHLFQVQFVNAHLQKKINDFISFYQSINVLIIDDVQEFAGQEKTQLAFFHIFNHLHQNGRQLILTSDRPPVALQGMEERLLTRFKWGLLAELEHPDVELRRDILRMKVRRDGLTISESVIDFIAQHVDKSIRDLEGVVNSLMVQSIVNGSEIDVALAENVIARTIGLSQQRKDITIEDILEQTCQAFHLDRSDLLSSSRKANTVLGRQVAMYLTQKHTRMSTTKIGIAIGRRNHATVVHSCQSIAQRLTTDADLRTRVSQLEAQLLNK